jgi:hypothetical protein
MNEMKRRVAAILEFISRMQVEMAANGEQSSAPNGGGGSTLVKSVEEQIGHVIQVEGLASEAEKSKARDFKDLTSVEMMDVLTRNLLKWQQEYGKYGEK